ncbi:hypothetical protein ACWCQW_21175 [Streptomyces mirabilis]
MAPIGEVAPAQGTGVEKYEEVGQTLTFSLGDGNAAHPLAITRLTVHGDVPSSVLSAERRAPGSAPCPRTAC